MSRTRSWPPVIHSRSVGWRLVLAGGIVVLLLAVGARPASARAPTALYYEAQSGPQSFAIEKLELSAPHTTTRVVALDNANVFGIALGGRSIYWSTQGGPRDRGTIMRASLDGGHVRRVVAGLTAVGSVIAAHGYLYWDDQNAIGRVALDGSHLQRRFIVLRQETGGGVADGLTTDGTHLYFSRCADRTIGRADLNGSHLEQRFISLNGGGCPQGLAVAGTHLFWTELGSGAIGRARLDGRGADSRWLNIHSRQGPFQVAAGGDHVYWTWGGVNGSPSYTGRADANRSHVDRRFLLDSMYPMALAPRAGGGG